MTRRAEHGGTAVLFALLISFVMFALAALVVDGGALRRDRRGAQSVADVAAIAGVMALWSDPFGASPAEGCEAAWSYFLLNSPDAPPTPHPCGGFPTLASSCSPSAPYVATGAAGDYTVRIQWPVPDDDPAMQGRLDVRVDGHPCERMLVHVQRSRDLVFAPAGVSSTATEATTGAPAVARSSLGQSLTQAVSLVVLDRTGCKALYNKGQGKVWVREAPGGGPGIITVDSDATGAGCTSGSERFAIGVDNNQHAQVRAGVVDDSGTVGHGIIFSYARFVDPTGARAYDPTDIPQRLAPEPIAAPHRVTRAPVDHRYNCKSSYPAEMDIDPCGDAGSRPAYIDRLRAAYGGTGAPSGFTRYTTYMATAYPLVKPCQTAPTDAPVVLPATIEQLDPATGQLVEVPANWWIDCPPANNGSPGFVIKNHFTIRGGDVVLDGGLEVASGATLITNSTGTVDQVMYVRASFVNKDAQATLAMHRTMVYVHNGFVTLGAGAPTLTWTAPLTGDFEDLALWSESTSAHLLGGQANLNIEGAFFTPNADPFEFNGQGDQQQTKAQFITHRLHLSGQGKLIMTPDPERSVLIPIFSVSLIR